MVVAGRTRVSSPGQKCLWLAVRAEEQRTAHERAEEVCHGQDESEADR